MGGRTRRTWTFATVLTVGAALSGCGLIAGIDDLTLGSDSGSGDASLDTVSPPVDSSASDAPMEASAQWRQSSTSASSPVFRYQKSGTSSFVCTLQVSMGTRRWDRSSRV